MYLKNIHRSFSARFSMAIMLIVGIFFMITSIVFYRYTYLSIYKQTQTQMTNLLQISNLEILRVLERTEQAPRNVKNFIAERALAPDSIYQITYDIVRNNPNIFGSAIAFKPNYYPEKGHYFSPYSWKNNEGIHSKQLGTDQYNYFEMDWYKKPKELEKEIWTDPYFDDGGGQTIMTTFSSPMFNRNNEFIGVITSDISLSWLTELSIRQKPFDDSQTFIISHTGEFIVHPQKEQVLNQTIFSIAEQPQNKELEKLGNEMISGKSGSLNLILDGKQMHAFYAPIERLEWSIVMICPHNTIYTELYKTNYIFIGIGLIGLVLILLFCQRIIRHLTSPVLSFIASANEIASGNLDTQLPDIQSEDEMLALRNAFQNMQSELKQHIASLQESTAANEKFESELRIAREIQMGMIPKKFPAFPERSDIDLYAILNPAKEVGGDIYDFFIKDEQLFFIMGDVSGKGIPASLVMAVTRTLFRIATIQQDNPAHIAFVINNALCENNETNMFVTTFIGILELKTGLLHYCNTGHTNPIYIESNKKIDFLLSQNNLPLGIQNNYIYKASQLHILPETTLFLYTDGLTEAENNKQEFYGEKRLISLLKQLPFGDAQTFVETVLTDVQQHVKEAEQSDDLAILCLTLKNETNKTLRLINQIEQIALIHPFIEKQCKSAGITDSQIIMEINLAIEEAVVNIISYAYGEKENQPIEICVRYNCSIIEFTLIDFGLPYDPTMQVDPDINTTIEERAIGGLGVFLIKQLMDEVSYERINEANILKIKKYIIEKNRQ